MSEPADIIFSISLVFHKAALLYNSSLLVILAYLPFFLSFCCLFLDKVSTCFTSHFHQKVIYFLFCPCFSFIMFYQCLCFHVTSCCTSRSNKQNEIKPGGEERIWDGWPDSFLPSLGLPPPGGAAQLRGAQTPCSSPRSPSAAQTSSSLFLLSDPVTWISQIAPKPASLYLCPLLRL